MNGVGEAYESLTVPGYIGVVNVVSATGEVVSGLTQSDFAASCASLLGQMGALIVVGDAIAKVCSTHLQDRGFLIMV